MLVKLRIRMTIFTHHIRIIFIRFMRNRNVVWILLVRSFSLFVAVIEGEAGDEDDCDDRDDVSENGEQIKIHQPKLIYSQVSAGPAAVPVKFHHCENVSQAPNGESYH